MIRPLLAPVNVRGMYMLILLNKTSLSVVGRMADLKNICYQLLSGYISLNLGSLEL